MMRIDLLTLFPEMFEGPFNHSMTKRAQDSGLVSIHTHNFRDYGKGKHKIVDDTPYGGGAGMLLKPEPLFEAIDDIRADFPSPNKRIILMDPAGKPFNHDLATELSQEDHLIFICGHYEGYDERIRSLVTDEISLGDYVLTGGEIGAIPMVDAIVRLLPGVLGNEESAEEDSFANGLLEHPHYTRPAEYRGMKVPQVLMEGNHKLIDEWRLKESLRRTYLRRPDLLETVELSEEAKKLLEEVKEEENKPLLDD